MVSAERREVQYDMMGGRNKVGANANVDSGAMEQGDCPAKRCKFSPSRQSPLTGAQYEPHQEQ